jgi:predicted TIM-barrel fold metal-dependent hydrolase
MAPREDLAFTGECNDAVLALADEPDGFFFAACSVHPTDGAAALEELRRVASVGAAWVKLHPNTQDFDVADPAVAAVVAEATTLGLQVLFDAYSPWDRGQPGTFIKLAMEVPESRLILAHAHGPDFPSLLVHEVVSRYP